MGGWLGGWVDEKRTSYWTWVGGWMGGLNELLHKCMGGWVGGWVKGLPLPCPSLLH